MSVNKSTHINRVTGDPYRYKCPDCGSHDVFKIQGGERPPGKTYAFNGRGREQAERDRRMKYRCDNCQERKMGLYDKKVGNVRESVT